MYSIPTWGSRLRRSLPLLLLLLLIGWAMPGGAAPDMDGDAVFHFAAGTHRLITWQEEDETAGLYRAKSQHSGNSGASWDTVRTYLTLSAGTYRVEDFDGVYLLDGGRVLASMLLQRASGRWLIAVVLSTDYGATWGALTPVFEIGGTLIDCPALSTHVRIGSPSEIRMLTTISPAAGSAFVYLMSSTDSGRTWSTRRLSAVPYQNPGGC